MELKKQLLVETAIVAVTLALVMGLVAAAAPWALRTPVRAAVTGLGAAFHLGFEATGLNRLYCTVGHACQRW